ncbi:MAG: DUF2157 domain-containing protein [Caldisericia bacterium]|nr:DUF2157 domain-containing protein [Caldisericia bacterium]
MNIQKQIQEWKNKEIISAEQSKVMLEDVTKDSQNDKSNVLVAIISIVGSILLSIGVVMFLEEAKDVSNLVKTIIIIAFTASIYYLGYYFIYGKKKLPKVGNSLVFLASLLFGASIFYIADFYKVDLYTHEKWVLLIWFIGVLPHLFIVKSKIIAFLVAVLFYVCLVFFAHDGEFVGSVVPYTLIPAGIFGFAISGLIQKKPLFNEIGNIFKIVSVNATLLSLLWFCFGKNGNNLQASGKAYVVLLVYCIVFTLAALTAVTMNIVFERNKDIFTRLVNCILLFVLALSSFVIFFLAQSQGIMLIFNLLFIALTLIIIFYIGNKTQDILAVNIGIFWLVIFTISRAIDLFGDKVPSFVIVSFSGAVLVLGGILVEKQRKKLTLYKSK